MVFPGLGGLGGSSINNKYYNIVVVRMDLSLREDKYEALLITEMGHVRHVNWTESSYRDRGYIPPSEHSSQNNIYIEGYANPVKNIEWDPETEIESGERGTAKVANFIPAMEWKNFREQQALEQMFYRKRDILGDIPWTPVLILVGLMGLLYIATQFI